MIRKSAALCEIKVFNNIFSTQSSLDIDLAPGFGCHHFLFLFFFTTEKLGSLDRDINHTHTHTKSIPLPPK